MANRIATYREFWPYYVSQHRDVTCRRLHFVGTSLVIGFVAGAALTRNPWWLLAAPVAGYGPAWIGHFGFEKNRPATFDYLLWSLMADFQMYGCTLSGRMGAELAKAEAAHPAT